MQLDFEGRLIVVKPLHIEETESSWNYRPVPGMTVAQALEFLRSNSGYVSPLAHGKQKEARQLCRALELRLYLFRFGR